jgi:hypothetical protein
MNCLAHAFKYLDCPEFAAGTCLPDWLGMLKPRVRVRHKQIVCFLGQSDAIGKRKRIAEGMLQHLSDDADFHGSLPFAHTCVSISNRLKADIGDGDGHRPAFVGHILTELLLDAWIEIRNPGTLDAYYRAMQSVSPADLQSTVNLISDLPTDRLESFMANYNAERFLFDYLDDNTMLRRLNRILLRVNLEPLPECALATIEHGRALVYGNAMELLAPVKLANIDR